MSRTPSSDKPHLQSFHGRHEEFTERAYGNEGVLPDRYVFVLTNLCNLSCSFCFQVRDRRDDAMTKEDWLRLVEQLPEYSRVTLTGGEPLAFRGFDEVFQAISERFDCNMISNGLLLSEKKIDYLLSRPRFKVLSISIDDIGNKNRDVRPEKWEHLVRMMRSFVERRDALGSECLLDVKTVVLDKNAHELFAIYKHCVEELRCDTHSFQLLKGSGLQHADYMVEFDELLKKSRAPVYAHYETIQSELERVRRYNVEQGRVSFLHPKAASLDDTEELPDLCFLNAVEHDARRFSPCKFPWSSVHINVDGHLFPCLAVSMGNVKTTPLAQIIHGERFRHFRDVIRREGSIEACNRCGWLRPLATADLESTRGATLVTARSG